MSNPSDSSAPARHANGRFGPGNPGRRAGARSRVSHRAAMAILQDFELHKGSVLERLRTQFAPAYFAVLTRLLDRELQVETAVQRHYCRYNSLMQIKSYQCCKHHLVYLRERVTHSDVTGSITHK